MVSRKLLHFWEEKYNLTWEYTPVKCQQCKLSINEMVSTCFLPWWCYDEIQREDYELKNRIGIRNALECQKTINKTVSRLNDILWYENTMIYWEKESSLYEKIKKSIILKLLNFKKIILWNL